MFPTKKINLQAVILKLLQEKPEIRLTDVAQTAELSVDYPRHRRAIQRAFASLIKEGIIQPEGQARARFYKLTFPGAAKQILQEPFKDIPRSRQANDLLSYVSQPIQARNPVGYNQEFLRSYEPGQSWYLNDATRAMLFKAGQTEPTTRPAGTYARTILNRLLIDLSWNSSRLEGNTYSLLETKRLIEFGESATDKDAAETQMILNHKNAIEYILESVDENKISFHEICSIHALLSENLLGDPSASGRIRQLSVGISETTYIPLNNPHLLKQYFEIFLEKLNRISDPFEQSFFSLVHLSYLQAFEDVNKRTSRLTANIPFIKNNLKPLSFTDVDQKAYMAALLGVYEKNDVSLLRDLYIWAYKRSAQRYTAIQQSMGEPNLFKLKHRAIIQEILRKIILEKIPEKRVAAKLHELIGEIHLTEQDAKELLQIIEIELMSLHEGNIARFKIKPSEYNEWKKAR